jgi:uncharacterized membrane protein YfcA
MGAEALAGIDALVVAELLLLGGVAGYLAGLLGIGGGMMMVPALTFVLTRRGVDPGLAVKMAIATSMATILFTSLSSVRAHHSRGAVRWPIVRAMAPGIVLGGLVAGAAVFAMLQGRWLALSFAAFVGFSAVRMLVAPPPKPTRSMPGPLGQAAMGSAIGFVSSLVGAGGAFLSVPFMSRGNVPLKEAVGTSAALGFPIALAGTAGFVISGHALPAALPGAWGYLYLPALAIIALASVTLAPLGARAAHRMDVRALRRWFALLLFSLAGYMLFKALGG